MGWDPNEMKHRTQVQLAALLVPLQQLVCGKLSHFHLTTRTATQHTTIYLKSRPAVLGALAQDIIEL